MPQPTKSALANLAVAALEDLKGIDIKVIDVASHTTVTEWWVICTGTSNRHVRSLAENVAEKAKEAGERPRSIQGLEKSDWVLVDMGSVVVHVLQVQARAHYQLEKLIPETMPEHPAAPRRKPAGGGKPKSKSGGKSGSKHKKAGRSAPKKGGWKPAKKGRRK